MRILYCNKYNYPFSGTEVFLFDLMRRMEERGHENALFSMDHGCDASFSGRSYLIPYLDFKDPGASLIEKARMGVHAVYSPSARRHMRDCLNDYRPDVAHVRGIYHHLSPSILWELKRRGVPVVYHVNDFKMLCPTYNLVAKGQTCESCTTGCYYHAVLQNCYGGGRARAAILASEAYFHRWMQTYHRCIDLLLAPSEFVRHKLIAAGFGEHQIEVLPHFQNVPSADHLLPDRGYVLYFGRLSAEKGLDDLLQAMTRLPYVPLFLAGDGPERSRLEALARDLNLTQVFFTGKLSGEKLDRLIAGCRFSVFPSHAYETFGKSILESNALGKPVVASDLGSRRELIDHGRTGVLYATGDRDQLADAIGYLFRHAGLAAKMGAEARQRVRERHAPAHYVDALLGVYSRLTARKPVTVAAKRSDTSASSHTGLRIAFIGGRGVVSRYSGVESYYEHVGPELAQLGHEITVYCRTYFTPALAWRHGMRIRRLPTLRTKHLETAIHTFLSTLAAMLSDCDIVHYQCLGPALFSLLPRLLGKRTIVTVQGLDWQRRKWGRFAARVLRWGEAAAVKFPNATMVVSKTLQTYYRERYGRDTTYVPNGANVTPRRPRKRLLEWDLQPGNYVLYLGRFSPEKNCHLLINAFEGLSTDMKLVLAGGTSHTDEYVEGLRRHASDRIRLLPWVAGEDLDELLSNAGVFVLPSDLEGLSLALLDAMAAGICVLTSDIPENREVVDGVGFTFRSGNQADLTRVLDILIRNPLLRRQMAEKARDRVNRSYLWPDIARAIEECYYGVLGGRADVSSIAPSTGTPEGASASVSGPAA
jgi:glycosyltransferase involved in cell wall biosynthesis